MAMWQHNVTLAITDVMRGASKQSFYQEADDKFLKDRRLVSITQIF